MVRRVHGKHLLDDDALGLLFGRNLRERDRQDAILHLGLHIFGLTRRVSVPTSRKQQTTCSPWSQREAVTSG
jgi:hypothetical protein